MGRRPFYRNERVSAPILLQLRGVLHEITPATQPRPLATCSNPSRVADTPPPARMMLQKKGATTIHPLNSEPPYGPYLPPRPTELGILSLNRLTGFPQGSAILGAFLSPELMISLACVSDIPYIIESLSPPYTRRLRAPLPPPLLHHQPHLLILQGAHIKSLVLGPPDLYFLSVLPFTILIRSALCPCHI